MISEEIAHIKGIPKKLVVFLHGYIDSAPSLDKKLLPLYNHLDDFAIHLPQAPLICEIHENKRQWYSMHRFDPEDDRKFVPTLDECVAIYDQMAAGLQETYGYLRPYLENCLNEYNLDFKDLYLCGFSQGAMVALYTALMSPENFGGVISFSGILAGAQHILKHAASHPDTLLIHGSADNLVRPEAQEFTKNKMQSLGCHVETCQIDRGLHMISAEGLKQAVLFIKNHENVESLSSAAAR